MSKILIKKLVKTSVEVSSPTPVVSSIPNVVPKKSPTVAPGYFQRYITNMQRYSAFRG